MLVLAGCGGGGPADEPGESMGDADRRVAIRVDGDTVSRARFNRRLDRQMQRFRRRLGQDTAASDTLSGPLRQLRGQMKRRLANRMVQRLLVTRAMNEAGVTVSDSEVEGQWRQLTRRFPNRESLQSTLRQQNTSETRVRSRIREKLRLQKYLDREIGPVEVSETEAREYFETHREEYDRPQQVHAQHILVRDDTGAQTQIRRIQRELEGDSTFEEVARTRSEGPSARKGGDLGFVSRGRMAKPFADAAFSLEPGTISEPVRTRFGYHLIRVIERRDTRTARYEDVSEEVLQALQQQKQRSRWRDLMQRLRRDATVEVNVIDDTPARRGMRGRPGTASRRMPGS